MKYLIYIILITWGFNSYATRIDTHSLDQLDPKALGSLEDLIGKDNLSALTGGVSDGGGNRGASAVFLRFLNHGYGIDAVNLNYLNETIKDAKLLNFVKDHYQTAIGTFGETEICVNFQGEPHNGVSLAHIFSKKVATLIVNDQYRNRFVYPRTYIYAGKSCAKISEATLQDVYKLAN